MTRKSACPIVAVKIHPAFFSRSDFMEETAPWTTGKDGRKYLRASYVRGLQERTDRLARLMQVARSMMAEMHDHEALLRRIIESVKNVMQSDLASLFLVDRRSGELVSRITLDGSAIRLPAGQGIVGHVASTGEIVNIPDAYEDPRFDRSNDEKSGYRTRSILCMPLRGHEGDIIGAIEVLNKVNGTYNEEDEELLSAFASLAGICLENASAYDQIEQERLQLEVKVQERTKDLSEEKKKSDELLLNILPEETAVELKRNGSYAPRRYELVTVMFTDFVGFTNIADHLDADTLVGELDKCFFYFDETVARNKLEKIKTLGDGYMCAGGLPKANRTNPVDTILVALEIQAFMNQMRDIKRDLGEEFWELRVGIHTGPVVAGVAGKHKFAYDIWGDTVNLAARMESSGTTGRVNISATTHDFVKDFFVTEHRGRFPVKYKGEIDMYYVNRIRPELSQDEDGRVPNAKFRELYAGLE